MIELVEKNIHQELIESRIAPWNQPINVTGKKSKKKLEAVALHAKIISEGEFFSWNEKAVNYLISQLIKKELLNHPKQHD